MIPNRRNTFQRIKVLEKLKAVKTHPKAEEVYTEVRKDLPTISLATVYRNLNLFAKEGQILRFEINGEYRYDGDVCGHQHLVCKSCGKIYDIFNNEVNNYVKKHLEGNDFEIECIGIFIKGKCRECQNDKK